ncbi:MAG TPA: hypothetical protein VLF21_03250 [Candidatus Saccharimonadales bacterium]|nr:hypothetical protein [Candidatus Saccharimonadales bacterium]
MRAREVQRAAKLIIADELAGRPFEVWCPPRLRTKGVKGDEPHVSKVVMVTACPDDGEPEEDFFKRMEELSKRLCNEIDDVSRVTLDVTRLRE